MPPLGVLSRREAKNCPKPCSSFLFAGVSEITVVVVVVKGGAVTGPEVAALLGEGLERGTGSEGRRKEKQGAHLPGESRCALFRKHGPSTQQ